MIDLIRSSIAALRFKLYRPEIQGPFSMDYRERRSHAQGMYLTQNVSCMRARWVKEEEAADTRIIVILDMNVCTKRKSLKQGLTGAEVLTT